jgi:3-hydroxyacyl-CoA dehydrogenase/enoyl-CoA hydratase/3-hydroxybutyryl-CoA epimerase
MAFERIEFEVKDNIAYIGFGKNETKSMTTLSRQTLEELREAVQNCQRKKDLVGVIFHSLKPDVFLAGVEIELINSMTSESEAQEGAASGQQIFNMIEDLHCSTIALIDGICLGGGLELSLACKKIAVSDSPKTKLGLPEVMLGVLPGFGGTYRLPKKIGLTSALDMILTGKQVRATAALKLGLADFIAPKERLLESAVKWLKTERKPIKKSVAVSLLEGSFVGRRIIFQKARENVLQKTKGFYPAPLKILEVLEKGYGKNREDYLHREAQAFGELSQTSQSKSLQHVFFLTDRSKKVDKTKADLKKIKNGAVLGAGTMGGGIAWLFAKNNISVLMKDVHTTGLELGLKQASENFKKEVKKRRLSEDDFNRKMRLISPSTSYDGFASADLVVEAIVEDMNIKKKVHAELETHVNNETIVTSNTSSLSIAEMSKAYQRPERFCGLHFFNPVNKMPLVEIILHDRVSQNVVDSLYAWVLAVGKTPVVVKDGPGFLVNRILAPYLNEAAYMLEEGYSIEDLDQVALDFGMPMGPCRLMDEVGLDVSQKVGKILFENLGERFRPSQISHKLVENGFLGKKNKKGFYLYADDDRNSVVNSELAKTFSSESKNGDVIEMQMRLFLPMINEAAACLSDGIVQDAFSIDLALIYGIGFPPFRGGLLKFAESQGIHNCLNKMKEFEKTVSAERYHPHPYLVKLAQQGQKFYTN